MRVPQEGENMTNILLVDDDREIAENLTIFLRRQGFQVVAAAGQTEALSVLSAQAIDLVLLDISLAEGNGFALCKAIKSTSAVPVIFLTASADEYSTVAGFDLGADDYIAKPFRPWELVCRIRNVLRLTGGSGPAIHLGHILIDTAKGIAARDGKDLNLSALEYRLLMFFLNNRGAALTRAQLLEAIWDVGGDFVNDNTLTVYIKRLREKLEEDPQNPQLIRTVRGIGYRLEAE